MNIIEERNNNISTIKVEGNLDTSTAPELQSYLDKVLKEVDSIVFDFINLNYISSAGLRVILAAIKSIKSEDVIKVINVNDTVMNIFELTGFDDLITIEPMK